MSGNSSVSKTQVRQPFTLRRSSVIPTPNDVSDKHAKITPRVLPSRLGTGSGRQGPKRIQKVISPSAVGMSKPSIRRLARRAGVKRISAGIYDEAPTALKQWLTNIVKDACILAEHAKRFTITTNDILMALKRNGHTLYGFAQMDRRMKTRRLSMQAVNAAVSKMGESSPEPVRNESDIGSLKKLGTDALLAFIDKYPDGAEPQSRLERYVLDYMNEKQETVDKKFVEVLIAQLENDGTFTLDKSSADPIVYYSF